MNFHRHPLFLACTTALGVALGAGSAVAQTAAGKPAAAARTSSLGNAATNAPILTRDQLRQCLTQRDELGARREQLQRERDALDKERAALQQEAEALKADRANVDRVQAAIGELNQRTRAFTARADAYSQRVKEQQATGKAPPPEMAKEVEAERVALGETQHKLKADQDALAQEAESVVKAYNAKAQARDAKVTVWNDANTKQLAATDAHESSAAAWKRECGDRRFREDDEKAIKAGK